MWRILAMVAVAASLSVKAQERFVTLTLVFESDRNGSTRTNTLAVAEGETATLVSFPDIYSQELTAQKPHYAFLSVEKDGHAMGTGIVNHDENWSTKQTPLIVAGPAKIHLYGELGMATFKISPTAYDPGKTAIVPPGPGGAEVQFECSTDLVHWTVATPGIYTNLPSAKFFRVNLKKVEAAP